MSGIGEALSAASSIAGLISLGIEVAKLLYSVADGISAAGEEVRAVALEVDMYTQTMEAIQDVLERQEQVSPSITGIIDRLVGICTPVFQTYKDMQKRLAPLLETFRNSQRKLDQVNLRFAWYFKTKKKVYGCRNALKRQFSLLTPILTALGLEKGGNSTQNNYYVQNLQVRVILQNSVESVKALHSPHGNRLLGFYQVGGTGQALLPPDNDSGLDEESTESPRIEMEAESDNETGEEATLRQASLSEALTNRLAVVRYHSPDEHDDETLTLGEVGEINEQVERALDESTKNMSNNDVDEIILETYSVETQFIRLITQILVDLSAGHRVPPEPMPPTPDSSSESHENKRQRNRSMLSSVTSTERHNDQDQSADQTSELASPNLEKHSVIIALPEGLSYRFPYKAVRDIKGLALALASMGFEIKEYANERDRRYHRSKALVDQVGDFLKSEKMVLMDPTGVVILPDLWRSFLRPGMTVQLQRAHSIHNRWKSKTEKFTGSLRNFFK